MFNVSGGDGATKGQGKKQKQDVPAFGRQKKK